MTAVISYNLD